MRNLFICLVVLLTLGQTSLAEALFIVSDSATTTATFQINYANDLIDDAIDISYAAPDPASGGSGTSWYTPDNRATLYFTFDQPLSLTRLYLWDYYGHTSTDWTLSLFDNISTSLLEYSFSITPGSDHTSTLHIVEFGITDNVYEAILANNNNSTDGGLGLSEVHFESAAPVPEPSTIVLLGAGFACLVFCRRNNNA